MLSPATAARIRRGIGRTSGTDLENIAPLLSCRRGSPSVRHRCSP
jgi:hypothetical protein